MVKVTSTQFIKTPGVYQDQAQREPVVVTKHNREHTVLLSAQEYHRLKRRDRQVFRTGELSDADIAAIAGALHSGGEEAQRLRDSLQPILSVPKAKSGRELVAFFRASPLVEAELPVERERAPGRAADLG